MSWHDIAGSRPAPIHSWFANDAFLPSAAPAGSVSRNERVLLAFDQSIAESAVFSGRMPAHYMSGGLSVEIAWVASGAIVGDAVWSVAIERIDAGIQNLDADGFAAPQSVTTTTPGTDGVTVRSVIAFTQAQADGLVAGDAFRLKVTRDAPNASDTLAADAQILLVAMEEV